MNFGKWPYIDSLWADFDTYWIDFEVLGDSGSFEVNVTIVILSSLYPMVTKVVKISAPGIQIWPLSG